MKIKRNIVIALIIALSITTSACSNNKENIVKKANVCEESKEIVNPEIENIFKDDIAENIGVTYVEKESSGNFLESVWYNDNKIPLGEIEMLIDQNEIDQKILYDSNRKRVYYIKTVSNPDYDPDSENFTCDIPMNLNYLCYFNLNNYEIGEDGFVKGKMIDEVFQSQVLLTDDGKYIFQTDNDGFLRVYDTDNNFNHFDVNLEYNQMPYNYSTYDMKKVDRNLVGVVGSVYNEEATTELYDNDELQYIMAEKMGYKPFYFYGKYENASDEYHFCISDNSKYYFYEIANKECNVIKEIDVANVIEKNKNGEVYYTELNNDGNRVLCCYDGKNYVKVSDYSDNSEFKHLIKDYYTLWSSDKNDYSIVHNGNIIGHINTNGVKMDLFVNYPSNKIIGLAEHQKEDNESNDFECNHTVYDAYLIDILGNNEQKLLMKDINSFHNFSNRYMSFVKNEKLNDNPNQFDDYYAFCGRTYLYNGRDLKMIIDESCHYGLDYYKGKDEVLTFGRQTGDRGGGSEGYIYYYPKTDQVIRMPDAEFSNILSENVNCSVIGEKAFIFKNNNIIETYNYDYWGNGEITENIIKAYTFPQRLDEDDI